ncbi:MAG TPA: STAS domain-containing protein [Leucothrix mucor]|uniref:STAS domain-containing protein n=1 Tax=Leucothrix mucor TaxID=45248 RepID=A0A7V2T091_LEUMU|nr:STAS domain-containing protein [Leucothrix mucor]
MPKLIKNQLGYQLQGSLVYDSVNDLIAKGSEAIAFESDTVQIDCKQLSRIDSAGVALFVSWQRYCDKKNQKLQLNNLPMQAVSLIKANKLDGFFALSS